MSTPTPTGHSNDPIAVIGVMRVDVVHPDGTADLSLLEVITCPTCNGTGLVAPDAFGDLQSWESWVAQVEAYEQENGLPTTCGSAIRSGLIKPMPCPRCGGEVSREA